MRLLLLELQEAVFRDADHVPAIAGRYIEIMDNAYAVRNAWRSPLRRRKAARLMELAQRLVGRSPDEGLEMEYRGAVPERAEARRIIYSLLRILEVPPRGARVPPGWTERIQ